jgi:carbon-monoxide dehydrogenase medium subunit
VKPASFAYRAPERVDDVLALLSDDDHDVRVIAGGQSLVPMMNFRLAAPEVLVDLNRVKELRAMTHHGDVLTVAAGVRQSQLLRDPEVARRWPLLVAGVRHIAHPQIRNRGTVCGSLAHHDPHGELPALAVALGARMTVASVAGKREVAADDFFVSHYEVALEQGEMLLDVRFPAPPAGAGWSFQEIARRRGDFALAGVAVLIEGDASGAVASSRVVLLGVGGRPYRARAAEQAIDGTDVGDGVLDEVERIVAASIEPSGDVHATAEYRREVAATLTRRAVAEAWERRGDV